MKCIKKSLSFILSLALVFNMFMGINISVYGYDEFIGFGIAGHGWENDTFALATEPGWYGENWDMEVGMDQIVSLGFVEEFPGGRAVTAPAEYDKIYFTDIFSRRNNYENEEKIKNAFEIKIKNNINNSSPIINKVDEDEDEDEKDNIIKKNNAKYCEILKNKLIRNINKASINTFDEF